MRNRVPNNPSTSATHGAIRHEPMWPACASDSVRTLSETYEGLEWDDDGNLDGRSKYIFVKLDHDSDVKPPDNLPYVTYEDSTFFLIRSDVDLEDYWLRRASQRLNDAVAGNAFIPEEADDLTDEIDSAKISRALDRYRDAIHQAQVAREAKDLLERERRPSLGIFASSAPINIERPMLIEGLIRDTGVSVFYGAFDEFKTTLILDMMAHVATGATWQQRKVSPRPVIWYALEGKEEIPARVRALNTRLKRRHTAWGEDPPIMLYDRIPEEYADWRKEITRANHRLQQYVDARRMLNDFKMTKANGFRRVDDSQRDSATDTIKVANLDDVPDDWSGYIITEGAEAGNELWAPILEPIYPQYFLHEDGVLPVIVIDTFSMALGGDDEKGPRAVGLIQSCLDLLKFRLDMGNPYDPETEPKKYDAWCEENPDLENIGEPVASHIIIIHHQTKTGTDFAGHRAIAANTQALYRVHRFGKITDADRPFAGQLTPVRVKGIPRPAPMRFEIDVVPVEGTNQTAVVLRDKVAAIPKDLGPTIEELSELEDPQEIAPSQLNECLDVVAAKGGKTGSTLRMSRRRLREKLEAAGVIEPVEDDDGKVVFYRFHEPS